jgi:CheY-like chemotaxis protein
MDLKMPIMNGFEAVTIMRQMGFAKTIIAQTAYASDDDRDKVMASGFNGFIAKPVKKEVLLETLKDLEDASPS